MYKTEHIVRIYTQHCTTVVASIIEGMGLRHLAVVIDSVIVLLIELLLSKFTNSGMLSSMINAVNK